MTGRNDAAPLTERECADLAKTWIGHGPDYVCNRLLATVRALREFSALQDNLLVCYRIGRAPTGKTLDRMRELRETLKGTSNE